MQLSKRVGDIEVSRSDMNSEWVSFTYHCNQDVAKQLDLRSYEDVQDAIYALEFVKAQLDDRRDFMRSERWKYAMNKS